MNHTYEEGMATRRKVLGEAHVNRAEADKTEFDTPYQALITEAAWGHVWSRKTISPAPWRGIRPPRSWSATSPSAGGRRSSCSR